MRSRLIVGAVVCAALAGGCSKSSSSDSGHPPSGPTTTAHIAAVASADPSAEAKMICEEEAQQDIADFAVGLDVIRPLKPTWNDHVYSCDYVYKNGATMTLSVKELSSDTETTGYYDALAERLGQRAPVYGLGEVAQGFATASGSVVVRKDDKVLLVDVTKLPSEFGDPADTRANVGVNVAITIMQCWKPAPNS